MLCLLGSPAVRLGGQLKPLALRPKALALLARVAIGGPVTRSDLASQLFPGAEDPRAALRWHLAYLRAQLPEMVRRQLVINPSVVHFTYPTDVEAFRQGARRILEQPAEPAATAVLALYRGDLCAGLVVSASAEFDTWLYVEQEALRRTFRQAVIAFARWALPAGQARAALEPLARLVSVDPYYEDGHVLLIEAYEALGRQDAAAMAYGRYRHLLREELQVEPSPTLVRRYEAEAPSGRTLPRDSLVSVPGITLHILEWPGPDPAIVALHGSAMSAYALTALAEQLAPACRFIAVDLRGHGLSDKPAHGYELSRHVEDVRSLLRALRLHRPVLLGFSMGGAIGAAVAAREDVGGLVLLDAIVGDRTFTENAVAQVLHAFGDTVGRRFGGFTEYLAHWRGLRGWSDEAEQQLARTVRYELSPLTDGSYRRRDIRSALEESWASLTNADSLKVLAGLRCPILIVHAARPWPGNQPYLPDAVIQDQLQAAPHASCFEARSSTHPMLVRDPEPKLVEAIQTFVRTHADTTAARVGPAA